MCVEVFLLGLRVCGLCIWVFMFVFCGYVFVCVCVCVCTCFCVREFVGLWMWRCLFVCVCVFEHLRVSGSVCLYGLRVFVFAVLCRVCLCLWPK